MGLGAITAVAGIIGGGRNNRKLRRLLKKAPKYKISEEAYQNQNIARSAAYGRNRAIQSQQTQNQQDTATAVSSVKDVTSNTSDLLSTIAAIKANSEASNRALAQDEATMQQSNIQQLIGVNNQMIDEKDKKWNYNENMPYQMKVAALRDKIKFNQELTMKGIEAQSAQDTAAIQSFGQMFGGMMGSDRRIKEDILPTEYGLNQIEQLEVVEFKYKNESGNHVGLIAQDTQQIIPESVKETDFSVEPGSPEKILAIDYNEIVPVLIKSVQQLSARVKELESELQKTSG